METQNFLIEEESDGSLTITTKRGGRSLQIFSSINLGEMKLHAHGDMVWMPGAINNLPVMTIKPR